MYGVYRRSKPGRALEVVEPNQQEKTEEMIDLSLSGRTRRQ